MEDAWVPIGSLWLLSGAVIAVLAVPMIKGQVRMNGLYGVRVKRSFESEELWYKINRQGGRYLLVAGAAVALLGVAAIILGPGHGEDLLIVFALAPVAMVLAATVACVRYAGRA